MPNVIYTPPKEIFEFQTETVAEKLNVGGLSHILNGIEVITNKGIFCSFEGVKYPKKGFPFPDAVHAINQVKRQTMMLVLPIARKEMVLPMSTLLLIGHKRRIKLLQNFLEHYNRNMEYIIHNVYVKREFMTPCAREIRNFIEVFLINR